MTDTCVHVNDDNGDTLMDPIKESDNNEIWGR